MPHKLLLESISREVKLTDSEKEKIKSAFNLKRIRKKTILLSQGDITNDFYFVNNGCLRSYYANESDYEYVLQFGTKGWWIGDTYSNVTGKEGNLYIETVKESEILVTTRQKQLALFNEVPSFERYFRIILERNVIALRERIINSMNLTAEQRYDNFCEKYPFLINSVPQKQIASYIGVTPEFLSKVRSLKAKK